MQASQQSQASSSGIRSFYHQHIPQIEPFSLSNFQDMADKKSTRGRSQATQVSIQEYTDHFFTLESTPAIDYTAYSNSPSAASVSSSRSPFSPLVSDLHQSYHSTYGSPLSESSGVDDESKLLHALWVLRTELIGPECDADFSSSLNGVVAQTSPFTWYNQMLEMAPNMDLKQLLLTCAKTVSEADSDPTVAASAAEALMDILDKRVSIFGDPLQRLGAYMLEGLRARLLSSGRIIYKKLSCNEPTGPDLLSYMQVIYQMCPYYKFAYRAANAIIGEAMAGESKIHIIDFQIAQGSQWVDFIKDVAMRRPSPPSIRITGVDDSDSVHARGGGLQLVGKRLSEVARSCGVAFEFHGAAMSGCEVQLENLRIGGEEEAVAVNFPYVLHHIPDESVSTVNHRDRILRLVKGVSPRVVALLEQESNTNTAAFLPRFREALEYYEAMFESIDESPRGRDDRMRMKTEEHCVAKDAVNIIACEGNDRVERHEVFGKWCRRMTMAGFEQMAVTPSAAKVVAEVLREYSGKYGMREESGALYLGWKERALVTASAWR